MGYLRFLIGKTKYAARHPLNTGASHRTPRCLLTERRGNDLNSGYPVCSTISNVNGRNKDGGFGGHVEMDIMVHRTPSD
jgi:hypothetical protein